MTAPTAAPGIDAQIASLQAKMTTGDRPLEAAIQTLRDYKRIMEAKVPEKPDVGRMSDLNALGTMIDAYDTLLDLLRRETAKNERIKELLREPSDDALRAATLAHQESPCHDLMGPMEDAITAFAAVLLAEVEKDK
jgi:hypothetical protein